MTGMVLGGVVNWILFIVIFFMVVTYALFFAVAYKAKKATVERTLSDPLWQPCRERVEKEIAWFEEQEKKQLYIITRDRIRLSGWYLPAQGESRGRVVLMHDYRIPAEVNYAGILRAYHENGYDVLAADERCHGESLGKYICFGARERFDCKLWIECINKVYGADKPVFLHGIGMGGTAVLMTAGLKLPRNVCGVVADSAFTSPYAEVKKQLKARHMASGLMIHYFNFWCRAMAGFKLKGASTQGALRKTALPVLLLHGEGDTLAPVAMAESNLEACAGEKALHLISGAGHGTGFWAAEGEIRGELLEFAGRHREIPAPEEAEQLDAPESAKAAEESAEAPEESAESAEQSAEAPEEEQ